MITSVLKSCFRFQHLHEIMILLIIFIVIISYHRICDRLPHFFLLLTKKMCSFRWLGAPPEKKLLAKVYATHAPHKKQYHIMMIFLSAFFDPLVFLLHLSFFVSRKFILPVWSWHQIFFRLSRANMSAHYRTLHEEFFQATMSNDLAIGVISSPISQLVFKKQARQ